MDGRDGRIKKGFNPLTFLGSDELKPLHEDQSWVFSGKRLDLGGQGLKDSTDAGLQYIIGKKKSNIDRKFGSGASDWLMQNREQFDPEDKFKLYYLFDGLQDPTGLDKINSKMYPSQPKPEGSGDWGGSLESNPFPGGKVRG